MKTIVRRGLATLLAICMMITLIPMTAFADEENECNHEYEWVNTATCTNAGNRSYRCKFCQEPNTENGVWQEYVGPLGHDYTKEDTTAEGACIKAPTCGEEGKYYYSCSRCGAVENDENHTFTVDASGHSLVNGQCENCEYKIPDETENAYIDINLSVYWDKDLAEEFDFTSYRPNSLKIEIWRRWEDRIINGVTQNGGDKKYIDATFDASNKSDDNKSWTYSKSNVEKYASNGAEYTYYLKYDKAVGEFDDGREVDIDNLYSISQEGNDIKCTLKTVTQNYNCSLELVGMALDWETFRNMRSLGVLPEVVTLYLQRKNLSDGTWDYVSSDSAGNCSVEQTKYVASFEIGELTKDNYKKLSGSWGNLPKYDKDHSQEVSYRVIECFTWADGTNTFWYSIGYSRNDVMKAESSIYKPILTSVNTTNTTTTLTNKIECFQIRLATIWDDEGNKYNSRPDEVNLKLTVGSDNLELKVKKPADVGAKNSDGTTSDGNSNSTGIIYVPKFLDDSILINSAYTVTEDAIEDKIYDGFGKKYQYTATVGSFELKNNIYNLVVTNKGQMSDYVCSTHTGGTATCKSKAICTVCGMEYGDKASHEMQLTEHDGVIVNGCKNCDYIISKINNGSSTKLSATFAAKAFSGADFSAKFLLQKKNSEGNWVDANSGDVFSVEAQSGVTVDTEDGVTVTLTDFGGADIKADYDGIVLRKNIIVEQELKPVAYRWLLSSVTVNGEAVSFDKSKWTEDSSEHTLKYNNACKLDNLGPDGTDVFFKTTATYNDYKILLTGERQIEIKAYIQDTDGTNIANDEDKMEGVYAEYQLYQNDIAYEEEPKKSLNISAFDENAECWKCEMTVPRYDNDGVEYNYSVNQVKIVDPKKAQDAYNTAMEYSSDIRENGNDIKLPCTIASFTNKVKGGGYDNNKLTFNIKKVWKDGGETNSRKESLVKIYRLKDEYGNDLSESVFISDVLLNAANNWQQSVFISKNGDSDNVNHYVVVESGFKVNDNLVEQNYEVTSLADIKGGATGNIKTGTIGGSDKTESDWDGLDYIYDSYLMEKGIDLNAVNYTITNVRTSKVNIDATVELDDSTISKVRYGLYCGDNQIASFDTSKTNVTQNWSSGMNHDDIEVSSVDNAVTLSIKGLDRFDGNGDSLYYSLKEIGIYSSASDSFISINNNQCYVDDKKYDVSSKRTVTYAKAKTHHSPDVYNYAFTNAALEGSVDIDIEWVDGNNRADTRDCVTIKLYRDGAGEPYATWIPSNDEESDSSHTFSNLPKYKAGTSVLSEYQLKVEKDYIYKMTGQIAGQDIETEFTLENDDSLTGTVKLTYIGLRGLQTLSFNGVTDNTVTKIYGDDKYTEAVSGAQTKVTYSSSNAEVAAVDAKGEVTIMGPGSATITATAALTTEYEAATASYTLIVKSTQNITFANVTEGSVVKTYGDNKFTETVTGAQTTVTYSSNNEEVATVNASTGEVTIKGAGSATITATAVETSEYTEATANYTLTVNKAKVDLPTAKTDLTYNKTEQTGVELPSEVVYTLSGNKGTNATSYTATAVLNDKANYEWNLETPTAADQQINWSIAKKEIHVTAVDKSSTVGSDLAALTYTCNDICEGDSFTGALETSADKTAVNTYDITQGTLSAGNNYHINYTKGTYTVTKIKVDLPTAKIGLTYDRTEQTGVELPSGAVYTLSDNKGTNATSYTATAVLNDKANYEWNLETPTTDDQQINWSIAKKEIHVTAVDKSSTVGSDLVALTYTCNDICEGDSFTGALETSADKTAVNTCDITQGTLSAGNNYHINYTKGTYTVTKIKVDLPTAKTGLTYDRTEQTGVEAPSGAVYTLSNNKGTNATSYTATAVLNDKSNYEWNLEIPTTDDQQINWSIAKKEIHVTAVDKSSAAGASLVALTYDCNDICVGDSFTGALATDADKDTVDTYDITQGTLSAGDNYHINYTKGTYTVNKTKVDLPTAKTGLTYNKTEQTGVELPSGAVYTISGNTGTDATSYTATVALIDKVNYEWNLETPSKDDQVIEWNIAPKEIHVSAEAKSSTVGSDLAALTYTCNDICEGDSFTGALTTNANKNVANTYDITQGTLSAGDNYEIIFTPGKYTVKAKQTPKQDNESSEKGSGSENANTGTNASSTDTKASIGASTDTNVGNNAATVKAQTRQSTTKKSSVTVKVDTEEALEDETLTVNDDSDKLEGDGSVEEESQNNSRDESENRIESDNESTVVGQDGNLAIVDEGNADSIDNNSNEADDNNVFTWLMLVCAAFVLAGGGTGILFVKKNKR